MINITVTVPDLDSVKKIDVNKAKRVALLASLTHMKDERLMNRFEYSGTQNSLGFKQRKSTYQKVKRERFPGSRGLAHVLTGSTKRAFKAATVVSKLVRGTIKVAGLNPGYGRLRRPKRIDMRGEVSRLSNADQKAMSEEYEKVFLTHIKTAIAKRRGKKIKPSS
jgi:hypothetical protein